MSGQCSRCALIAAEAKARVEKSLVAGNAATSSRTEVLSGESPGNPRATGPYGPDPAVRVRRSQRAGRELVFGIGSRPEQSGP